MDNLNPCSITIPVTWQMWGTVTVSYQPGEPLDRVIDRAIEQASTERGTYIDASLAEDSEGILSQNPGRTAELVAHFPELALQAEIESQIPFQSL